MNEYSAPNHNQFRSIKKTIAVGAAALALYGCYFHHKTEERLRSIEDCLETEFNIDASLRTHPDSGFIIIPQEILEETNTCMSMLNRGQYPQTP